MFPYVVRICIKVVLVELGIKKNNLLMIQQGWRQHLKHYLHIYTCTHIKREAVSGAASLCWSEVSKVGGVQDVVLDLGISVLGQVSLRTQRRRVKQSRRTRWKQTEGQTENVRLLMRVRGKTNTESSSNSRLEDRLLHMDCSVSYSVLSKVLVHLVLGTQLFPCTERTLLILATGQTTTRLPWKPEE